MSLEILNTDQERIKRLQMMVERYYAHNILFAL